MKKLIVICLVTLTTIGAFAQSNTANKIEVSGKGSVTTTPDGVTIAVRVDTEGTNIKDVKSKNDNSVDATLKFLKKMKLDSKDYHTQRVELSKNYVYDKSPATYTASQTLIIHLKDMERYEDLMTGLLESGVNRINSITFTTSKLEELQSEARKKAVENAKLKAQEYADALGQEMGRALYLSESSSSSPMPMFKVSNMAMATESLDTLAAGEMEVSVSVQVAFELQ